MHKKWKEKVQYLKNVWKQKSRECAKEMMYFLKEMEPLEQVHRVIKIAGGIGLTVFVILMMGKTIQYVVTSTPEKEMHTSVVKETEVVKANPTMQEQYKKLVKRVEELAKSGMKEAEIEKITEVLHGEKGAAGAAGKNGENGSSGSIGETGKAGVAGVDGSNGKDGKSAYEQAVEAGYQGTEAEFAKSMSTVEGRIQILETRINDTEKQVDITKEQILLTKQDLTTIDKRLTITDTAVSTVSANLLQTDTTITTANENQTIIGNQVLSLEEAFNAHIAQMQQTIDEMRVNFRNGCNIIAAAITAKGVDTPANTTPQKMADNISHLADMQYKQGYTDGTAALGAADVVYEYHHHDGNAESGGGCFQNAEYHQHNESCYGYCEEKTLRYDDDYRDGRGNHRYRYKCPRCGFSESAYSSNGEKHGKIHISATPICGRNDNELLGYTCTCGYSEDEIISAVIRY